MKSRTQMIISMAIFGTIGIVTRNIDLGASEKSLFRAIIALAALLLFQASTKSLLNLKEAKKDLLKLFLSGAAMGINWILFFAAQDNTSIALATLSYYFAPVIVMIVSPIIFKERFKAKKIICFVMSTLGLILMVGFSNEGGSDNLKGILFGIGAAVFYAIVVLINKSTKSVTGINRTVIQLSSSIIVLLPYVLLKEGFHIASLDSKGILFLLVLGIVYTAAPYCLYFSSLKALDGQEVAILSYIDPLVAVIFSVTLLDKNNILTPIQLAGGAAILIFTLINELKLEKKNKLSELEKERV
ncbi:MAG: DMT family transporter [Bacillota bacterium]|nr:DMT family transporter [Bacillota bacterium]